MSPKPPRKEGARSPQRRHGGIKNGIWSAAIIQLPNTRYQIFDSHISASSIWLLYREFDIYGSKLPLSVRARKGEAGSKWKGHASESTASHWHRQSAWATITDSHENFKLQHLSRVFLIFLLVRQDRRGCNSKAQYLRIHKSLHKPITECEPQTRFPPLPVHIQFLSQSTNRKHGGSEDTRT